MAVPFTKACDFETASKTHFRENFGLKLVISEFFRKIQF
jgi:hypothetical protein